MASARPDSRAESAMDVVVDPAVGAAKSKPRGWDAADRHSFFHNVCRCSPSAVTSDCHTSLALLRKACGGDAYSTIGYRLTFPHHPTGEEGREGVLRPARAANDAHDVPVKLLTVGAQCCTHCRPPTYAGELASSSFKVPLISIGQWCSSLKPPPVTDWNFPMLLQCRDCRDSY